MFSRARAHSFFSSVSASQRDAPSMFRATASAIARTASRRAARANNAQRFMSSGASVEEEIGTSHRASSFIHSFIIERRVRVTRTARSRSLMRPLAAPSRALDRGHATEKTLTYYISHDVSFDAHSGDEQVARGERDRDPGVRGVCGVHPEQRRAPAQGRDGV